MQAVLWRILDENRANRPFLPADRDDEKCFCAVGLHRDPIELRRPSILRRIGHPEIFAFLQGHDELRQLVAMQLHSACVGAAVAMIGVFACQHAPIGAETPEADPSAGRNLEKSLRQRPWVTALCGIEQARIRSDLGKCCALPADGALALGQDPGIAIRAQAQSYEQNRQR